MNKLILKLDKDWIEATFINVASILEEVEKDVDGVITKEEKITEEEIHCESFSGHPEHIAMLRDKCEVYGVKLSIDDEKLIDEVGNNFTMPSQEKLDKINLDNLKIELKSAKKLALDNIVVTVNDKTFDGNETARTNMISAILSADLIGKNEETWKLADNTKVLVTLVELRQALALAIREVGRIVNCTIIGEL